MTYCVALRLDSGMIFASDSRTNAGVDNISVFRKMIVYEKPGDRFMVLLSAGNLSISQSVREILQVEKLPNGDDEPTPQTVLSNWLINIQAKKIDRPEPAHLYQGCIHAWNAYRDGKAITAIRDDIKKNFFTIHE